MSARRTRKNSIEKIVIGTDASDHQNERTDARRTRRKNGLKNVAVSVNRQVTQLHAQQIVALLTKTYFQVVKRLKVKRSRFVCWMICSERQRQLLASTGSRYQLNK